MRESTFGVCYKGSVPEHSPPKSTVIGNWYYVITWLCTTFFQIDITVLAVETVHGPPQKAYDDYMITQGYVNYKHIKMVEEIVGVYVDDTIFVKKTYLKERGLLKEWNKDHI